MDILLVDDDEVDRALIVRALKKSELDVCITEANTVDRGLSLYAQHRFDMVMLDYTMPQRDGIEMIVEIRNEPNQQGTAIIMLSASEDEDLALACIRAGAQDFLVKSDISQFRLRRALLHASTRFELETQLIDTYKKVKLLAETDALTGLPNRYFFDSSLKLALTATSRNGKKLALLLLDLDNFKLANDNYGHDVGDILLKRVVNRIQGCLRGNELFARLGGDEFAITLGELDCGAHASLVAQRILRVMQKPLDIDGSVIKTTASIGLAIYPDNGRSSEELFKFADIAMYRAKKLGRNQACFFEEEMQRQFSLRMRVEDELRNAVERKQLLLHYQPVIDPSNGALMGFEALVRWQIHGGLRMPDEFIAVAEETNQISLIGYWVMDEAIATLAAWMKRYKQGLHIAINVSAIQLSDRAFVNRLKNSLLHYQVAPERVDIELTETVLFKETPETMHVMKGLSELGVRLSLDDFGTGYSSISLLSNFPISVVKIDKSIMPKSLNDTKNTALVKSLVSMAVILGLDIIAEGVETDLHVGLCRDLGIRRVQGYYYSKPLSQHAIETQYFSC